MCEVCLVFLGRTIADIWNEEVEGFNSDGWDVPKNYQDLHPGSSYRY